MTTECVLWTGRVATNGYGAASVDGREWKAHRLAYEREIGPIPEGYEIDHLCETRLCVNPKHLEPVTPTEHRQRTAARRTTCRNGHPLDAMTRHRGRKPYRVCSTCRREWQRKADAKRGWRRFENLEEA